MVPRRERVDLALEVGALFAFYDAYAEERGVGLALSGTAAIEGDPLMVRRALGNLLSNAIRHTARGGTVGCVSRPDCPAKSMSASRFPARQSRPSICSASSSVSIASIRRAKRQVTSSDSAWRSQVHRPGARRDDSGKLRHDWTRFEITFRPLASGGLGTESEPIQRRTTSARVADHREIALAEEPERAHCIA